MGLSCRSRFLSACPAVVAVLPLADVPGRQNLRWVHVREAVAFAPGLLALMLFAMFLYIEAEHILNIWLAKFQVEAFGAGQGTAAVALSVFFAGIMAGRFLSVPVARRMAASTLLAVSSGLMALFILLTALVPVFVVSEIGVFLTGLGAAAAYPMLTSYMYRFPERFSGLVFSIITLVVIVSGAVFAYAAGPAAQALGMKRPWLSRPSLLWEWWWWPSSCRRSRPARDLLAGSRSPREYLDGSSTRRRIYS